MQDLLQVENLSAIIPFKEGAERCFSEITFSIREGESLGILGERDSGKSSLLLAMLGLFEKTMLYRLVSKQSVRLVSCRIVPTTKLPPLDGWSETVSGRSLYKGHDLLGEHSEVLSTGEIGYIPEDNSRKIEVMLFRRDEDLGTVFKENDSELKRRLVESLGLGNLEEKSQERVLNPALLKPSEIRKIGILSVLLTKPKLLIIDEPTDAFEPTELRQVISTIQLAREEIGFSMLVTSQDAGVLAELTDRLTVIYAGYLMEEWSTNEMIMEPEHPYSQVLMTSNPTIIMMRMRKGKRELMRGVQGIPAETNNPPNGCPFHPRCNQAIGTCPEIKPEYRESGERHWIACHLH